MQRLIFKSWRKIVASVLVLYSLIGGLLFPVPLTDSLHPGSDGTPAFGKYDSNSQIKMVLYPAFIGWTLVGIWIVTLRYRLRLIKHKIQISTP